MSIPANTLAYGQQSTCHLLGFSRAARRNGRSTPCAFIARAAPSGGDALKLVLRLHRRT